MTAAGLLVTFLLKPAAVIVIAFAVTTTMRRASAAARHVVWCSAIGAALALPLLGLALPAVRVEAPRWLWSADRGGLSESASTPSALPRAEGSASPDRLNAPASAASNPAPRASRNAETGAALIMLVWLVVAASLATRRIVAERAVVRIAHDAIPAGSRTRRLAARAARRHGLGGGTRVSVTDRISSPVVAGVTRPVVLLPPNAERWPDDDLDRVLVHELCHVARRDCLVNFCADVAAAITWYNPLVRYAVRRMRLEAEQACDESVLRTGADAEGYAHLLLRIARADQVHGRVPSVATAMARVRQLEERIVALLEGKVRRTPLSAAMAGLLAIGSVALTIPVSTFTLVAAELPAPGQTAPEPTQRGEPSVLLPEPDQLGDVLASPQSERIPAISPSSRSITEALGGPDSVLAHILVSGLDRVPEHEGDLVSARAAWALSQVRNGRLVEPLIERLASDDWRIQSYAAWSLALARDSRAVPHLIAMLDHRVWRARAMAAYALRESADSTALVPMTTALGDPAWQVRVEAVGYLAAVGGSEVEPLLRARLDDRHIAVRRAARRALTQP